MDETYVCLPVVLLGGEVQVVILVHVAVQMVHVLQVPPPVKRLLMESIIVELLVRELVEHVAQVMIVIAVMAQI